MTPVSCTLGPAISFYFCTSAATMPRPCIFLWLTCLRSPQHFTKFHQYFGVILVGLLFVQISLGVLHHSNYKKLGKRTFWSYAHIWVGRSVIAGAIINGGIGLGMMDASKGAIAVYAVFSVLVTCGYSGYAFIRAKTAAPSNSARLP